MLKRSERKEDSTIKAAKITVKYTVITSVLLGAIAFSAIFGEEIKSNVKSFMLDREAKQIVEKYYPNSSIKFEKCVWFDFIGDGQKKEFYSSYFAGKKRVVEVFSTRNGKPESIFHNVDSIGDWGNVDFLVYDKQVFLTFWSVGGSGGFLSMALYKYDGVGKADKFYSLPPGLGRGNPIIVNNKELYLKGKNLNYKLNKNNNGFQLVEYKEKPLPNQGTHVLSISKNQNIIEAYFDGHKLNWNNKQKSFDLIAIKENEILVIESNNTKEDVDIMMDSSILDFKAGLVITSVAKKGIGDITIDKENKIPVKVIDQDENLPLIIK